MVREKKTTKSGFCSKTTRRPQRLVSESFETLYPLRAKFTVMIIFLGKSPPSLQKLPSLFRSVREEKDKKENEWEKTKTEDAEHSQASKGRVSRAR